MKEKILDAAAQLIQQYGLKKFTVDEIAAKLKISKKTIYQYFNSKNDIIKEYFETAIESDKNGIINGLNSDKDFFEKIHLIVYSSHRYRLPVKLLNEAKQFYPDEWIKVEELKQFKLNAMQKLLELGTAEGKLRSDIHFGVLSKILERISDMFIDYDFLLQNKLNAREAMDKALEIIFKGILVQS